jgi:large subunit ribosomal protein L28
MTKICQVTKKGPTRGIKYSVRGVAKKKKGIGLKTNGKTRRTFYPNLMKKRFWFAEENRFVTLRLSMQAVRMIDKSGLASIVAKLRAEGTKV